MHFLWELVYLNETKTVTHNVNATNVMPLMDTESHPRGSWTPVRSVVSLLSFGAGVGDATVHEHFY